MDNNDFLNNNNGLNNNTNFDNNNLNSDFFANQESVTANDEAPISMLLQPQNSSEVSQNDVVENQQISNQNVMEPMSVVNTMGDNLSQQDNFNQDNIDFINQNNDFNTIPQKDFQNTVIDNMSSQNFDYATQALNNENSFDDEELLEVFIGKNYNKITNNPFNFAGFFFTTAYLFYRKMFLYGMILFFANIIISLLSGNAYVSIIIGAGVGFLVNKVYLGYAKKKIANIKLKNASKSFEEIKMICSKKGGTSIGLVILGSLLQIVIVVVVTVVAFVFGATALFGSLFTGILDQVQNGEIQENESNNSMTSEINDTYDGVMMYDTSIKMKNEFAISVPSVFKDESDEYEYEYVYESGQGVFDDCSVSLFVPSGYSSAENLINQLAVYNKDNNPTSVASATLNGIEWHAFSYNDVFGTKYYYGTTKNNKVYLLEYEVQEDAANDCDSYRQSILNSIVSK